MSYLSHRVVRWDKDGVDSQNVSVQRGEMRETSPKEHRPHGGEVQPEIFIYIL